MLLTNWSNTVNYTGERKVCFFCMVQKSPFALSVVIRRDRSDSFDKSRLTKRSQRTIARFRTRARELVSMVNKHRIQLTSVQTLVFKFNFYILSGSFYHANAHTYIHMRILSSLTYSLKYHNLTLILNISIINLQYK